MTEIVLTTFDWVPEAPRGYVRDLRVRCALEEAKLPYSGKTTPFRARSEEHLACQPFAQVPWITNGATSIFESGAILLYLGGLSATLMPIEPAKRINVIEWLFAALNSVEMPSVPWSLFKFTNDETDTPGRRALDGFLNARLERMENVLKHREWLAESFSIADIAMSDVMRLVDRFDGVAEFPAIRAYVERATARPSFAKAYADQVAHFAARD